MNLHGKKSILLKRAAPWVMAALILFFLFSRIDRGLFMESLVRAELSIYIPLIVVFILIWFFIESYNVQSLYRYFGHPIEFSRMLRIRGATFLLMIINYGLGAGGIAIYMKKFRGVPFLRSSGMLFFYMVVESAGIALLAVAGFVLAGGSGIYAWVLYAGMGLFSFYNFEIIFLKYMPPVGFLKKFLNSSFVAPIRQSTGKIYAGIFFQRIGYFLTFVVFFYFGVRAFHMDIPFLALMALVPIIFFVGNLPITPFGLGTIQAAMLYFFKSYSSEENILALSILYSVSLLFFRAIIGLYFLKKITADIPGLGLGLEDEEKALEETIFGSEHVNAEIRG